VSRNGEITTLGRGGSDTTAVALGIALKADHVEFFKDVPGVFTEDPKKNPLAEKHTKLTYEEALTIVSNGAKILHPRCIQLAAKNALPLHVRSFKEDGEGTLIGSSFERQFSTCFFEEE
jgi:aspartate kinase